MLLPTLLLATQLAPARLVNADSCAFAAFRCTRPAAAARRPTDEKLQNYCDQWKAPCIQAGFTWFVKGK